MNFIPAYEIKKHGVSVIEKRLKHGPVHVLKHNRPIFVVMTEEAYQKLSQQQTASSGLFSMLNKPSSGSRSKKDIDTQISRERDDWNDKL